MKKTNKEKTKNNNRASLSYGTISRILIYVLLQSQQKKKGGKKGYNKYVYTYLKK